MTATRNPEKAKPLAALLNAGEGPTLEFKRSTGELKKGMQTLCAFLNSKGGTVLFSVNRKSGAEGQQVSEQTVHDITAAFGRFEPPVNMQVGRIKVRADREVIALHAHAHHESVPFAFEGRATKIGIKSLHLICPREKQPRRRAQSEAAQILPTLMCPAGHIKAAGACAASLIWAGSSRTAPASYQKPGCGIDFSNIEMVYF